MTFFYPGINLSLVDMFKVIRDGQLVDKINDPSPLEPISSPVKDTQANPEGDKVVKDINLGETHQGDTSEERQVPR